MSSSDLLLLFGRFLCLSLLSVGGAISTAPDMQRFLVTDHHWITDVQFNASIALAQAAPGPNVLFVAVLGWSVAGPLGALACITGILLPSSLLVVWTTRVGKAHRETRAVRAIASGLAPITVGLTLATGWILGEHAAHHIGSIALVAVSIAVFMRTKLSPLVMIAVGAAAGILGLA